MLAKQMLCFLLPISLVACGDVAIDDRTSDSTTTGGASFCSTGAARTKLGTSNDGATAGIVSDGSGVYWVNDSGQVWRAEPVDSSPEVMVEGVGELLWTIAVDADAVYVIDYAKALYRIEKTTLAVKTLAMGSFVAVAADGQRVYITQPDGLYSLDKQGGTLELLATIEGADSVAVDETNVYVRSVGTSADLMARVVRVSKAGGDAVDIAQKAPLAYHYFSQEIVVDATHVYWIDSSAGTLSSALKGGGGEEILAKGLADPVSVAVDEAFVYFSVRGKDGGSLDDRAVAKVPKAGGAIMYIAHGADVSAFGVAVDGTNTYWTQAVTGGVVETACK
jgi:hypothetical protein